MRSATCLTLLAIGATLTFAVTGHPSFLNLQVLGLVIMATGLIGLFLPRRGREGRPGPLIVRQKGSESGLRRARRPRAPHFAQPGADNALAQRAHDPARRGAETPTVPDLIWQDHSADQ